MGWLSQKRSVPGPSVEGMVPDEVKQSGALAQLLSAQGMTQLGTDPDYPASTFLSHITHGYDKNELVYACIEERATSVPDAPLRVYDGRGRMRDPLESHPLRRLLASPNPIMSDVELDEMTELHLNLAGNAFWEIVPDRAGRPVELWPLRPDLVRMKRGTSQIHYGYDVNGTTTPVDVIHFRKTSPVDGIVGTPPMRAALRATALDSEATDFVKALLQNHAIPGVVVKMANLESVLDDATTKRLKAKWKQSYGGRNRGEPAFLQAGMDVQELGLNLKDLEFPDLRTISESRICMSFGVPPILVGAKVGLDRSTFANYKEARASFWEESLIPARKKIARTVTKHLVPRFSGPGSRRIEVRPDWSEVEALREAEESRWQRATDAFRAGGLTLNDYRHEIGLEAVDGGDVFLVPSGVVATRDVSGVMSSVNAATAPSAAPGEGAE